MISKITFIYTILSCLAFPIFACSCVAFDDKGFCDFVDYAEFVVDAHVVERMDDQGKLIIRINEVFRGGVLPDELVLQNVMCGTWLREELGDHFILGLNQFEHDSSENIFYLPLCGVYHLQIDGNRIKGDITKNRKSMSYNAFRELIQTQSCPASVPRFRVFVEEQSIQISTLYEKLDGDISIRLYNMNGQVVSNLNLRMAGRISERKTFDKTLTSGIYVVYIDLGNNHVQVEKVLVR